MPFESLEKLWMYCEAKALYNEIHDLTKEVKHEYCIKDQVDRSSQSVCDNIAEMYGAYYYQVKIASLRISRREAYETNNHLSKFSGTKLLPAETCEKLVERYDKLILGINKYIRYIKSCSDKK